MGTRIPTIEIMSILKSERPIIFTLIRQNKVSYLSMLTHVVIDSEEAKERLCKIIEGEDITE
jgi:hypothetical protein